MRTLLPFSLLLFCTYVFSFGQSGCPGCVVTIPPIGTDTFYLSDIPDGQVGVYYDADLSFRLPMTTNSVPGAPPDLTITQITISSIADLPPGMNWQANQTVFDPSVQTDGCVKMCGTPLESDSFFITVNIVAVVFGISQGATYVIPMYVAPSVSISDGFSIINSSGCGFATAEFINNVPSNGADGFTYFWDFGNGNLSDQENPSPQTYYDPGTYYINYHATIDTSGYYLSTIYVEGSPCNDDIPPFLTGPPDLYLKLYDPAGNLLLTTGTIENASYPAPFTINQYIDTGSYTVQVWDEDSFLGGDDDDCGTIVFTQTTDGLSQNGNLFLTFNTLHIVTEVNSLDSVTVYEIPANPLINANGSLAFCQGDSVMLSSNYTEPILWYEDGVLTSESLDYWAFNGGNYQANFINEYGCASSLSNEITLTELSLPELPAYFNQNNELILFDPSALPGMFELQWYLNEVIIPGETTEVLCATVSGLYSLEVTDLETGCSNIFSTNVVINPAYDCTVRTKQPGMASFELFPNPVTDRLYIEGVLLYPIFIRDISGAMVSEISSGDPERLMIEVNSWPSGMYIIEAQSATARFVITR